MGVGLTVSVVTLFPELMREYFATSILGRCVDEGTVRFNVVNPRDFTFDRHRTVDDAPYGGGAGMVLLSEPLSAALDSVDAKYRTVVFPTPAGNPFSQREAERIAGNGDLVLICGRYEGIDQRVVDEYGVVEYSIGDYVLSSGELAAMVIVDAVYRLIDGVIRKESVEEESFQEGLLEYPHYTRPETFRGRPVPDVLLSGHHAEIAAWRRRERVRRTAERRPDMIEKASLSEEERRLAVEIMRRR